MILTAGLTPAWQQIMVFQDFRQGEVNRAEETLWFGSGKVFNAGIGVHHLGGPSLTLATVGGPPLVEIDHEFDATGLRRRWVNTAVATRICTTIIERDTGRITELVENGRPVTPDELDEFRRAYAEEAARAEVVILIGSLPVGVPASFYRELVERTPCPAVLDFRGEGLLSVLELKPLLVKPNREELAQTVGRPLNDEDALRAAMQSLNHRGAQWVLVTQGPGPVWLTSVSQVYRFQPLPPRAGVLLNPIASGDAMAAAIAWATRGGCDMVQAVRLGIAAAHQNLHELLPCRLDESEMREQAVKVLVETLT